MRFVIQVKPVDFNFSKDKTMEGVMSALDNLYEKTLVFNKVFLMKHIFSMNMSEGGYVSNHLNEFNMLTNQLSCVGVKFNDEVRYFLILCSLI